MSIREIPNLEQITAICKKYASARDEVEWATLDIQEAQRRIARQKMPVLKRRIAAASAAKEELFSAIEAAPELFEKPRTQAVEGIKFGLRKMPGAIAIADQEKTMALIEKHLPEMQEQLVIVKRSLSSAALRKLAGRDLARIGVALGRDTDEVLIKPVSGDLEKLVDALLGDYDNAA